MRVSDADRAKVVERLQQTCPRWLIIWSPWRQTFTAFACFTAERTVIDYADEATFLKLIRRIELAHSVGATGPP
jgi:hypothetical protein